MRKCVVRTVSSRRCIDFPVPPLEEVPPLSASASCCARARAPRARAHTHTHALARMFARLLFSLFALLVLMDRWTHVAVASLSGARCPVLITPSQRRRYPPKRGSRGALLLLLCLAAGFTRKHWRLALLLFTYYLLRSVSLKEGAQCPVFLTRAEFRTLDITCLSSKISSALRLSSSQLEASGTNTLALYTLPFGLRLATR